MSGRAPDVYRLAMYRALRPFLESLRGSAAVEVSGRALVDEFGFSPGRVRLLALPRFDLMAPPNERAWAELDSAFDVAMLDQVLEHVPSPGAAIDHLRRLLRPGGWAVVTTVFMFPVHDDDTSGDFFRFSPRALGGLFPDRSWGEASVGSWGSREALRHVADWKTNNRDPALAGLAATNEPDTPVMVWALARKASDHSPPRIGSQTIDKG